MVNCTDIMNKLVKFLFAAGVFMALAACSRQLEEDHFVYGGKTVTFTATFQQTRTALGEPEGSMWPNLWCEGDVISVNGVLSEPLSAEAAGGSTATFTVHGVSAPYEAVYPAGATEIPTEQTYVEGSYDPAAFVMHASSNTIDLDFVPQSTIFRFTPTGDGGELISGVYVNGYKMTAPNGVELGKPWFVTIAPGDYTQQGIRVIVRDTEGGAMLRSAATTKEYVAGGMYSASLDYVPDPEILNVYGIVTCGGQGVPDVLVSDGVNIVKTNSKGRYAFHSDKKWQNVFITIPTGYEAPLNGTRPAYYKPLDEDEFTPEQADFELIESPVEDFRLLVLGDIHLARRTNDLEQFSKVSKTILDNIDNAPGKVYAVTLGDHAWDMYWVSNNFNLTDFVNTMDETFASRNVPFFYTMGNHDNEMEVSGDVDKALAYIHKVAPTYYSFNLGKIHFIVLDNMDFTGVPSGQSHRSEYKKNFTADQLEWLRQDLSYVDKSTPIFLTAHEPMAVPDNLGWKEELDGADADKEAFLQIFDGYDVNMITGHTHSMFNRTLAPNFHEHNYGAVCGTWWWSGYLTAGIHIGQEGTPGGIGIFDFSGKNFTHYYQAAGHDRDYQFRAYDMNKVKEYVTMDLAGGHSDFTKYYDYIQNFESNVIYVNVWDWDETWNVEIIEDGNPLEVTRVGGSYDPLHIVAFTAPRLKISSASESPSFQTRKWNHYFKATASSATSPVTVRVTDRYGNVFTEEMTRPKDFSIAEYRNAAARTGLVATPLSESSSTLAFKWTQGDSSGDDVTSPYKASLYRDQSCTDLVVSFDIPADHSCWDGKGPRFTFAGLEPSTTYWFQVQDTVSGEKSTPISSTTKDFTVVDPSTVSNAGVGDVILAEDFSEIAWGSDMLCTAAGFIPSGKPLEPLSGDITTSNGSFLVYDNTSGRIYGDARVTSDKRLYNWGFFGNSSVFSYAGYLRVGSSDSGARTHIVSPALSGIPAGKIATIDVTVTSSTYNSGTDVAVFINDHTSLTLVLAPDQKESTNPKFSSSGGKYTGASLTGGYPLEAEVKSWTTKTVRINGVTRNDCLIIGSYENVDTKNRFFLDDVKVEIVSLEDIPAVSASFGKASSSTLSFTWTEGEGASNDIAKPWTIALYRDKACTELEASFNIPAGNSCWNSKQPRFVFSGLTPSTKYYFKATDTSSGNEKVSNVVEATTLPFTHVYPEDVPVAAAGDVILAEDFGELCWCGDLPDAAVGYDVGGNSQSSLYSRNYTNTFQKGTTSPGTERIIGSQSTALNETGLRLAKWAQGNNNLYIHPGYFKFSTNTTNRAHIITPALTSIPDGMTATIDVTVTAAGWGANYTMIAAVQHSNVSSIKDLPASNNSVLDFSHKASITLNGGSQKWSTQTITLSGVAKGDRIAIGSTETVSTGKGRVMLSDVVITVTAIEDPNRTVKVSVIGDSISTFAGWCDTTKGGAYYPRSGCDVTSVGDTWWYKLIYNKMTTTKFEANISAGNTTVVQNTSGDSSAYWYGWDFGTRLQSLGIGEPDVVFIHGGTNDYGHTSWYSTSEELINGVAMNVSSFPSSAQDELDILFELADAATTVDAADALDGTTFCAAYIRLIKMIQTRHPGVKIVCVIGDYLRGGQGDAIKLIANHFGEDQVRYADILGEKVTIAKYANPHPNAAGMATMAEFIYSKVGSWIDE